VRVLGLDPSLTNYGWCLIDTEASPIVVDRGRFQTTPKTLLIERYISHRESIRDLCITNKVTIVGIESPPFGEQWSEGLYALFLFIFEALYLTKQNVFFWDPLTVKSRAKEILGREKGKMFKIDMIDAAKKETGIKSKWNSDTADAFHVAHITSRFVKFLTGEIGKEDLTIREDWIFLGIKKIRKTGELKKRGMSYRENDRYFLFGDLDAKVK